LPKIDNPFEAEIKRHKDLLRRAADALEKWCVPMHRSESKLIDELRKAAE
jgi:hypothetical protein